MNAAAPTPDPTIPFTIPQLPPSEVAAAEHITEGPDSAQKEAAALSSGLSRSQLAERAKASEFSRSERFRDHFEKLAIVALWCASIGIAIIAGVWLLHMILPMQSRWLTTEDLSHLQSIITAGLLVGVIGNHFKKRLG